MLLCAGGTVDGVTPDDQATLDSLLWRTEREALVAAFESPTLATCQALILLAIKAHRQSRHTQSWNFVGIIEEFEVLSLMFPPETATGPGYVLSTFNAYCRLAVIMEKVMDLRMNFPSTSARDAAVAAVDRVCQRWVESLPTQLRLTSDRRQPANVLSVHAMLHCCVILLHISPATDALKAGKTPSEDFSLRRLLEASSVMGKMIGAAGQHYIISMQTALPVTFPPLLFASANAIIGTPETLVANQRVLGGLRQLRDEGRAFDSHASVTHKINSIMTLAPPLASGLISAPDDLFHRRPSYATQPRADPWMDAPSNAGAFDPYASQSGHLPPPPEGMQWSAGPSSAPGDGYFRGAQDVPGPYPFR
ncbi:hypothetical protein RQP46_010254 [Phenoliferia psychrophenolica]